MKLQFALALLEIINGNNYAQAPETQMLRAIDWYTGIQRMTFGTTGLFLLDRTCINPCEFLNSFL